MQVKRYLGKPNLLIQDFDWLIKELKEENECIKIGMISEPLSGFVGFMYGLKKDFNLTDGDFAMVKGFVNDTAMEMGYTDIRTIEPKNITHYVYGDLDDLIKILEAAKKVVSNQCKKFN